MIAITLLRCPLHIFLIQRHYLPLDDLIARIPFLDLHSSPITTPPQSTYYSFCAIFVVFRDGKKEISFILLTGYNELYNKTSQSGLPVPLGIGPLAPLLSLCITGLLTSFVVFRFFAASLQE